MCAWIDAEVGNTPFLKKKAVKHMPVTVDLHRSSGDLRHELRHRRSCIVPSGEQLWQRRRIILLCEQAAATYFKSNKVASP
jgi:hypothetical protein